MVRKRKKKRKLGPEERKKRRIERKFKTDINRIFVNSSFIHLPTRNVVIDIKGRKGEIDAIFMYENILVISEDTTLNREDEIKKHLLKTIDFFKHIKTHKLELIKILNTTFSKFRKERSSKYVDSDFKLVLLYCPLNRIDTKYKERHPDVIFLEYPYLQYFLRLSKTISKSTRFEIFKFMRLCIKDIGVQKSATSEHSYQAFLLPESPSGFPSGYKVVSFLIEPSRLIEQCYVLRKDGWQDRDCLYQRLLVKNKIVSMREYLTDEGRVFVNNIVVTLPSDTGVFDENGKQIEVSSIEEMQSVDIKIKREFSSIGIIDGQHRVFSYHEGTDKADKTISILREKQHLLLTGIIYPKRTTEMEKIKFEAKLFLEINDRQTRAKGYLKQAIEAIVNPFSPIAIGKSVVTNLGQTGPLTGLLEEYFYDRRKIKTTSIVSYGLKHIVNIKGDHSLFSIWRMHNKKKLYKEKYKEKDKELLGEYIEFCTKKINDILSGFKMNIPTMWTTDKKVSRALTTTTINGLIFCLRKLIENKKTGSLEFYSEKFKKLDINFKPSEFKYRSSHWKSLGEKIYEQCFID